MMAAPAHVALAFGLVIAAGAATCLGAALVFCTSAANHRLLSGALGVSAGVMAYVSFVEIFCFKAVDAFTSYGLAPHVSMRYATFCFFGGALFTWLLDKVVHALMHAAEARDARRAQRRAGDGARVGAAPAANAAGAARAVEVGAAAAVAAVAAPGAAGAAGNCCRCSERKGGEQSGDVGAAPGVWAGAAADDAADVEAGGGPDARRGPGVRHAAAPAQRCGCGPSAADGDACGASSRTSSGRPGCGAPEALLACRVCDGGSHCPHGGVVAAVPKSATPELRRVLEADHHAALARVGLLSALAVGLHNVPEGLATFVATLASPSAGAAIAVAIALHNIPEGVVVAMPIYYATGSRLKGFAWSLVSAAAEPLGGLIGYGLLVAGGGGAPHPLMFAVCFGAVAGIMVYIAIRELLPTALRYDPEDRYATNGFFLGAAVMAASLLLFKA